MKVEVKRNRRMTNFTGGEMYINGAFFCYTCEDVERPVKMAGLTAIPAGDYPLTITYSNRFKRPLPLVGNVPNFTGIRIHAGNTEADTEGCILVGLTELKTGVGNSRAAMAKLMPLLMTHLDKGGKAWLTVG